MGERDGHKYLCALAKDQRQHPTFVYYAVDVKKEGSYTLCCDIKTDCPESRLWVSIDDGLICKIPCDIAGEKGSWHTVSHNIPPGEGKHILKIMVVNDPEEKFEYHDGWYVPTVDLALDNIVISKIN